MASLLAIIACVMVSRPAQAQLEARTVGKLQEVFAWKQLTYDINGFSLVQDRSGAVEDEEAQVERSRRQADPGSFVFQDRDQGNRRPWEATGRPRPSSTTSTTRRPSSEENQFFIQYNNLPMGVERVGNRLFITVPRRHYGIPSTLNYLDLTRDSNQRSPPLRPYPNLRESRNLTSVYRTRADSCGRLWMVDTGLMEIPNNPQQVQPPAIVIYDLNSNRQILRYPFKTTDIPAANTPTGLASITVDITGDCSSAFAYVPDLTTYGLIVYSLRGNDSWRLTHNYFSFQPTAGNLNIAGCKLDGSASESDSGAGSDFRGTIESIEFVLHCDKSLSRLLASRTAQIAVEFAAEGKMRSKITAHGPRNGLALHYLFPEQSTDEALIFGQRFQWSDGIFSITLTEPRSDGCRAAYFHPMVSTQEFSVSTCVLKNRTASSDSNYWSQYALLGERGQRSQATMHDFHAGSGTVLFAEIGRDALSCWATARPLAPTSIAVVAQDSQRFSYPADLHVTGSEVWVLTNTLPRFGYARLDVNEYNFYVYKGDIYDLISGTVCDTRGQVMGK